MTPLITLAEFIQQNIEPRKRARAWVACPGFDVMYVRLTQRWVAGEFLEPVLDLASMTAASPGAGAFTKLVKQLRAEHPKMHLYVEETHERFGAYLVKLGFEELDPSIHGHSYLWRAAIYVQEYPCSCEGHKGTCWIVRHPACVPPVSYGTRQEALDALRELGGK